MPRRRALALALVLSLVATGCGGRAEDPALTRPSQPVSLATFLRTWIDEGRATYERFDYLEDSTRYLAAPFASPDGRRSGYVVHLVGRAFCADDAAGCTTLVVAREAEAYRVVGRFTNTHLPVSVFADTSHGWPDVGVWLSGGGMQEPRHVQLRFDGREYPEDVWTAPRARTSGLEVLSDSTAWRWLRTPAP